MPIPPLLSVTAGGTTYRFPLVPFSERFGVTGAVREFHIVSTTSSGFPEAKPIVNNPIFDNYLPHSHWEQRPPYSIGLQNRYEPGFIWDEYNVVSYFPGAITLGPLKQANTFTGAPATFKVSVAGGDSDGLVGGGFSEALSALWLRGNGNAANDEPLWYLSGSTFTNSTVNADTGDDFRTCSGVVEIGGTAYVIGMRLVGASYSGSLADGAGTNTVFKSTDKTTWSLDASDANTETFPTGVTFLAFLSTHSSVVTTAVVLVSVAWYYTGKMILVRRTPGTKNWTAIGTYVQGDGSASSPATNGSPRGLVTWHDSVGAEDCFFASNRAFYWVDVSANITYELRKFNNPESAYTGQMVVSEKGIVFIDGPNAWLFRWGDKGVPEVIPLGPEQLPRDDLPWDGVPLEAQGNMTAIGVSKIRPSLVYCAKGGLAASRNARIYVFDLSNNTWHCIYRNSTAQRAITALYEYGSNLYVIEESSAGGTQAPQYFTDTPLNPVNDTSYLFAASGQLTTSRFNGLSYALKKNFLKHRIIADGLNANETVTTKVATNGGALGTGQAMTSSPGSIWIDGATALGTSAYDINLEIDLARGGTNTNSPKLLAYSIEYQVLALKDDGTPVRHFKFRISLNPADYSTNGTPNSPLTAVKNLDTILQTVPLATIHFDQQVTSAAEAKVRFKPFERHANLTEPTSQTGSTIAAGYIEVECAEVI